MFQISQDGGKHNWLCDWKQGLVQVFPVSYHMALGKLQISLGLSFCKMRDLNWSLKVHSENQSVVNVLSFYKTECFTGHFL